MIPAPHLLDGPAPFATGIKVHSKRVDEGQIPSRRHDIVIRERLKLQRSSNGNGASEILSERYANAGDIVPEQLRPNAAEGCKCQRNTHKLDCRSAEKLLMLKRVYLT